MRVFNQDKTKELKEYDLTKGWLNQDKLLIAHIDYKEGKLPKYHYDVKVYPNGGEDLIKVIDEEGEEEILEHDEFEDILVYIPFTEKELAKIELNELLKWFEEYDNQVKQYERCTRLNIEYDKDINAFDIQAEKNAKRITEIRNMLK